MRIAFSVRYSARDGLSPDAVGEVGGLSPDAVGDDARRSRLGPPVAEISTELDLSHGESEPFRAHWQASLVTSSDFVGCERDFVGVNVTS